MQLFPRSLNRLPAVAALSVVMLGGLVTFLFWYYGSPRHLAVGFQPRQPVPFSHRLHAGQMGMDCRYCHANIERSPIAMIPPTQTCMNCHSIVRTDSQRLAPVRESWCASLPPAERNATSCPGVANERIAQLGPQNAAVPWIQVHRLPDHAYFDHSVHLSAGVGCSSCHGRIDQMEIVRQNQPLSMSWCLDCHRDPGPNLRPRDQITNMAWTPNPSAQTRPVRAVQPPQHCSGCHR